MVNFASRLEQYKEVKESVYLDVVQTIKTVCMEMGQISTIPITPDHFTWNNPSLIGGVE